MKSVKFADMVKQSGGIDGRLAVCFMYAENLTFKIQGQGLMVWVTGDDENKQLIIDDITSLIPQRDHKVRKNFKAFKDSFIQTLESKGLTNAEREHEKDESQFSIPDISSVIKH